MDKLNWKALVQNIESRKVPERIVLMLLLALVLAYLWLVFVRDPLAASRAGLDRMILIENGRLAEQNNITREIQSSYTRDPDAVLLERRQELLDATVEVDEQLDTLYNQLVLPREMAGVLTGILQEETELRLVSIENLEPVVLVTAGAGATVPVSGRTAGEVTQTTNDASLQVYRHGIRMRLQGSYLEMIRYLKKLESQDTGFFWEELVLDAEDYPVALIELTIYTLSSQREWIGV